MTRIVFSPWGSLPIKVPFADTCLLAVLTLSLHSPCNLSHPCLPHPEEHQQQHTHAYPLLLPFASAEISDKVPPAECCWQWCYRLTTSLGDILLRLLAWEQNCYTLLANGLAVGLVQRLAASLDQYIADEGADKELCKDSATLDRLLRV